MKKKIAMLILWIVLTIGSGVAIGIFSNKDIALGEAFAGALIAIFIERAVSALQDLVDTTNWKTTQRRLKRGGFIDDDTLIRISFAYLYRIKLGNKYLLVQNSRNTGKYQPVGGVYKLKANEKTELKNRFHVMDDDKILIDESSKNDYRLRMENRYLRKFVRRFDSDKAQRERVDNLGRELKEELIDTGIVSWTQIQYRYCGRHISELSFGEHFQIYELLMADVVELILTADQETDLKNLLDSSSEKFRFATADQIICLGMNTEAEELYEWIGDHTKKILQENEGRLMKVEGVGKTYTISI